ncbi:MAG: (2Fe-2S)-binding protein [Pseudobdellovibrionaceae bacterium]|jgi:isoquinoline 1-oxidoreductase alpha subunit
MELNVNGKNIAIEASDDTPLLWALRDELNLTGTKYGCGISACGACTVHIDGTPMRSCVMTIGQVASKKIVTIEGLNTKIATAIQEAWSKLSVAQCGYCQSGQVMSATALLSKNKKPTDADIDTAMRGNICRCGSYSEIRQAIHQAAKTIA